MINPYLKIREKRLYTYDFTPLSNHNPLYMIKLLTFMIITLKVISIVIYTVSVRPLNFIN